MNKMMVAIFDNEAAADAGLQALHVLDANGDITLYASGVVAKDANGTVRVVKPILQSPEGTGAGLAVGSLIGLLGGPVGLAVGALTGTVVGAIRDFWAAGVGLDFVEEAGRNLQKGKVGLVAELEEEWVVPVNTALEAVGAHIMRRARSDVAQVQMEHDVLSLKAEASELENEVSHAMGVAKDKLQAALTKTNAALEQAANRAKSNVKELKHDADAKADALKKQLSIAQGDAKARIEARIKLAKSAYHARGAKLSQAWELTKDAMAL